MTETTDAGPLAADFGAVLVAVALAVVVLAVAWNRAVPRSESPSACCFRQ